MPISSTGGTDLNASPRSVPGQWSESTFSSYAQEQVLAELGRLQNRVASLEFELAQKSCMPSRPSSRGQASQSPKERILRLVAQLSKENMQLRGENAVLRAELADVFRVAQPLIEAAPCALENQAAEQQPDCAPEEEGIPADVGPRFQMRPTLMAYHKLGANELDNADSLKAKYRDKQKQLHPDKGGSHEDFLELQNAAEKLTQKRASFAAVLGRTASGENPAASGTGKEIESDWLPLEAGWTALGDKLASLQTSGMAAISDHADVSAGTMLK